MQVSYSRETREGNWYVEGSREGKWNRGKKRRQKENGIQRKERGDGGKQRRQKEKGIQRNVEEIDLKEMKRNIKEMR